MLSSETIDMYRDFAAGVFLSEAQNPIPPPPPLIHCIRLYSIQYTYSHREGWGGGGGGEMNQRER